MPTATGAAALEQQHSGPAGQPAGPVRGRLTQIGEAAERVGLSIRTIRHYHEVGLIVPAARSEGGFRSTRPAVTHRAGKGLTP